jgi:D-lactate dehydrogenase (cytochrome)
MLARSSTRVGQLTAESCGVRAGVGRITQKRWASNKDQKPVPDGERPFYLQLQESIQERVQKEKAEQLQIQSLQQRTARGRFWATLTGMHATVAIIGKDPYADIAQLSPSLAPWATTTAS